MEVITLTEEQFDKQFTLVKNHLDDNAGFDGAMFETFGEELEYVHKFAQEGRNLRRVWTIVDGDGDNLYYCNGCRFVNRLGYLITEEEWEGETDVEIDMSMD